MPGVERLSVSVLRPDFGLAPPHDVPTAVVCPEHPEWLKPQGVLFVKGWTRSTALFTVLLCAYECGGSELETDRLVVSCPVMCCVQGLAGGFAEEQAGSVRVRTVRKLPHAGLWGPRGAMWRARRAPIRRPLCCKTEARSAFSRSWTCVF